MDAETLVVVAVGAGLTFFLGYIGNRWLDRSRRRRKLAEVVPKVCVELSDLHARFALAAYAIAERTGKLDRPFLDWLSSAIAVGRSELIVPALSQHIAHLRSDPLYFQVNAAKEAAKRASGTGLTFPHYDAPYLKHNIGALEGLTGVCRARAGFPS